MVDIEKIKNDWFSEVYQVKSYDPLCITKYLLTIHVRYVVKAETAAPVIHARIIMLSAFQIKLTKLRFQNCFKTASESRPK